MTSRKKGAEQGFTLVELLLVMVILPLVAGAIAVAIIATEKNAGTTKTILSDSANAQISSQYYVPDVQAAQFVTTMPTVASPFSGASPQVCGWDKGTQLLLGLYRPTSWTAGAPTGLATTPSNSGGTLTAAAAPYAYQVTAVDGDGETLPSASVNATIASGTTGSVTLNWNSVAGATGYNVYGRTAGSIGLLATVTATTYVDTGSPTAGAAPPSYLSVGYWLTTANGSSSIVRYSCNLDANFNATVRAGGTVILSDDINATAQAAATITPARFATAAANGWAPVTASTTVTTTTSLPASTTTMFTLSVNWTGGFDVSQPLTLSTSGGFQSITCSQPSLSVPGTSFTNCLNTSGIANTTVAGSSVSQAASISAINLAVFQPGSSYNFRLDAVPRAFATVGSSVAGGAGTGSPALLTLGGADNIQGGPQNAVLHVNGNVNINGGTLTCTGGPNLYAYGYGALSGISAFNPSDCATGGPTITQPKPIPDPYANVVANLVFPALTVNPAGCAPGEYTSVFNCGTLTPGIYKLDAGFSNNVSVSCPTCSSAPGGQGVLLYLPPGNESFSTSGNQTINIPAGLSATQSAQLFHTTSGLRTTALQGLIVWQDQANSTTATIRGTSGVGTNFGGTLYFPSAQVNLQGGGTGTNISTGRIIALNFHLAGSGNALINPK